MSALGPQYNARAILVPRASLTQDRVAADVQLFDKDGNLFNFDNTGGSGSVTVDGEAVEALNIDSAAVTADDVGAISVPGDDDPVGSVPMKLVDGTTRWLVPGTPPTTPGTPVATAGAGVITLTWDASTSPNGVSGYNVYRSDAPTTILGSPTTNNFTDTHPTADTEYTYTVKAFDIAGQLSDASADSNSAESETVENFVSDSFTGTAGTALQTHTGETGATWANDSPTNGAIHIGSQGDVYNAGAAQAGFLASGTPPSANYSVEADIIFRSAISGESVGVLARAVFTSGTVAHAYALRYAVTSGQWQLLLFNGTSFAATPTTLGSQAASVANGDTKHVKLTVDGTTITAFVDDEQIIQETDATLSAAGLTGIVYTGSVARTDTTGAHIDNFTAHA